MPPESSRPAPTLRECPLLPLRNQVVFPGCRAEVQVVRPMSRALVESLDPGAAQVALFVQRDVGTQEPGEEDLHPIGVVARVLGAQRHGDLGFVLQVEGLERARLRRIGTGAAFLVADVELLGELETAGDEVAAQGLRAIAEEILPEACGPHEGNGDAPTPGRLADRLAAGVNASHEERVDVLQTTEAAQRLDRVHGLVQRQRDWQRSLQQLDLPTVDNLQDLWVLRDDGPARIAAGERDGSWTAVEAADLRRFREDGYVVWEGLYQDGEIDAFLQDVVDIREHPGRYLLTDHRRGRPFRASGPDFDHFENVYDTYVNLESARRICFHPRILRFLEILFDERPIATQQLLFQRSNQHPLHQDTAYVCTREPLLMVATWVALEDVVQGRGELTYYRGSHRVPHYRFADGSKWFHPELDDADAARDEILKRSEALGCEKRDFLARKGDVFLWAADLLHGSNPRTRPEEETRRSLVTHYCPESNSPLYFLRGEPYRGLQPCGDRALLASSHYRLPTTEPFARPAFPLPEPC